MLSGSFEHRIDEKGRVLIPPKFRKDLADGCVLSFGPDNNLILYPVAEWNKITAELSSGGVLETSKIRRLKRAIFGNSYTNELDGQGRVALPAKLREYAGIESDVVIVGVGDKMEVWNKDSWEKELSADLAQHWQDIESLKNR